MCTAQRDKRCNLTSVAAWLIKCKQVSRYSVCAAAVETSSVQAGSFSTCDPGLFIFSDEPTGYM